MGLKRGGPACLALFLLLACVRPPIGSSPEAIGGKLSLRADDFAHRDSITLNGEWEFYWRKFWAPADFSSGRAGQNPDFIAFPGIWNDRRVGSVALTPEGFATYRLRLSGLPSEELLGLHLLNVNSAYRLYANGRLLLQNGIVSDEPSTGRPAWLPATGRFHAPDGELELILHVANFYHRKGGPDSAVRLGRADLIEEWRADRLHFSIFLFGALAMMGLYHLISFALRPRDLAPLYFGIFCLLMAGRTTVTGEKWLFQKFALADWDVLVRIEYLNFYWSLPAFVMFIAVLFPLFQRKFAYFVVLASCLFSLGVLLTPVRVFSDWLVYFQGLTVISSAYVIFCLFRSLAAEGEKSILFITGFLLMFVTILNDFLHNHEVIQSLYLTPVGFFLFNFSQSFYLARRMDRAFRAEEAQAEELERQVQKRTRQLEEANARLNRLDLERQHFFTDIAHELRTPLTLILNPLERLIADDSPTPERYSKHLRTMRFNAGRLLRLTNDLLDSVRLELGREHLDRQLMDLNRLVRSVAESFATNIDLAGLAFRLKQTPEPLEVFADPERLERILFNLLGNALANTRSGSIALELRREPDARVAIAVSDTGTGIDPRHHERIFERFYQVPGVWRRQQGSGLGLYFARHVARMHGGDISVRSVPGQGSEFLLTLPASVPRDPGHDGIGEAADGETADDDLFEFVSPEPDRNRESAVADRQVSAAAPEVVLVVEDDPWMRDYLKEILEPHFVVRTAENGRAAWSAILHARPDLVVADIMMPELDGLELMKKIHERDEMARISVILLTARGGDQERLSALSSGAAEYLTKPFQSDELIVRIKNLLALGRKRKVALGRMRESIYSDLHDHLGAALTDMAVLIDRMKPEGGVSPSHLEGMEASLASINLVFRDRLARISDLELLEQDWLQGLHSLLLRRYSAAGRILYFRFRGDRQRPIRLHPAYLEDLYHLFQEIVTNDLKYGRDETRWRILLLDSGQVAIRVRAARGPDSGEQASGQGRHIIARRIRRLGGTLETLRSGRSYRIHIVLPADSSRPLEPGP